jgi:ABC-type uncharacterized transport system auxiliary subunit
MTLNPNRNAMHILSQPGRHVPGWPTLMAATLLILTFALHGCGSTKPVKYYQLTHPTVAPTGQAAVDVSLVVRLFSTSHLYREDRIVYGSENQQVGAYETQRWTEPPSELLREALVRGLRFSGHFRSVSTLRSDSTAEFVLSGHLYDFREITGGAMAARLNYDVEMRELKTGKTVWSHSYNHDEPCSGKEVISVVSAMDKNVQRSVEEVQAGVDEYFRNRPVK